MFQPPDHYHNVSLQLSEVLDDIGVNQRLVEKRNRAFMLLEGLQNVYCKIGYKEEIGTYFFGSQTEGSTTVGLCSDIDCLFFPYRVKVIPDWSEWEPFDGVQLLMLQDQTTNPGYCLLQLVKSDVPLPLQNIQYKDFTTDCRGRVLLEHSVFLRHVQIRSVRRGPAISATIRNNALNSADAVLALYCSSWPGEAHPWLHKQSTSGWPTKRMKRFAAQSGCFLVPVASRDSEHEDTEWRISTSLAERCLMLCLHLTQLRCYILMKMITKSFLHPEFKDCVTSFICKTVLFHCIADSTGREFWCDHNLLTCLNTCLQRLFHCILTENCPQFIIPGNNLLRGKLSSGIKQRLAEKLCDLTGDSVRALTGVRIDDLGIRLSIKFGQVVDVALLSKDDIHKMVVSKNFEFVVRFGFTNLDRTLNGFSTCRDIHGKLRHCIFLMCQIHTVGSVFEKKACMLLMPHLFKTLGSVVASEDIAQGRGLSPESLTWFWAGLDSDVATSRLKLTSALYCAGEFSRCEVILNNLEQKLTSLPVASFCFCGDNIMTYREFHEDICDKNEGEAIQENTAFCVKYLPSETCIPVELKYELFRSTGDDVQCRAEKDYWMNWATVDALPYLYFLQYKVYKQLHKPVDQRRALDNLARIIYSDLRLGRKETALNLLGQCYEQENQIRYAMCCYMMSLNMSDITKINVGGKNMTTRLSVLTKEPESALAAMFTGDDVTDKDEDGRYFIDCNAVTFQYILDFLRCGKLPSHEQAVDVYIMAVHFGLKSLQKELEMFKSVQCRKKVDAMKNGPLSEQYQELKEKAVDALKISRSFDNIYLLVAAKSACYSCQGKLHYGHLYHYAKIHVEFELSDEMLWCLTEELHWLGFGKYINNCRISPGVPVPTFGRFYDCTNCHQKHIWLLLLSTHENAH